MTAPVSYINLMKAQRKRHDLPVNVGPSVSYSEMVRSGIAARARLFGPATPPNKIEIPPVALPPIPIALEQEGHGVPLNLLTPCHSRFLVRLVEAWRDLPPRTVAGPSKERHVVAARDEAIRLIFQHTQNSLPMIGHIVNRDHTTVLHSLRKTGVVHRLVELLPDTISRSRPKVRDVLTIAPSASLALPGHRIASQIIGEICSRYRLREAELLSNRRASDVVQARHEAIYRIKHETTLTMPEIGRIMGDRDHKTIAYAAKAHEARLAGLPLPRRGAA
jgi:hypothetical protein